jgi:hypothetical protein
MVREIDLNSATHACCSRCAINSSTATSTAVGHNDMVVNKRRGRKAVAEPSVMLHRRQEYDRRTAVVA